MKIIEGQISIADLMALIEDIWKDRKRATVLEVLTLVRNTFYDRQSFINSFQSVISFIETWDDNDFDFMDAFNKYIKSIEEDAVRKYKEHLFLEKLDKIK